LLACVPLPRWEIGVGELIASGENDTNQIGEPRAGVGVLGDRQMRIYLPRGLVGRMVRSYLGNVSDRWSRVLIRFISAFVTGASVA